MTRLLRFANRLIPRCVVVLTAASVALFAGTTARADKLWVSSSSGSAVLEIANVKIAQIDDTAATFTNPGGRDATRDAKQVVQIAIDDEPVFSAADEAFAKEKWEPAVDGYVKAIKSTKRDWLKDYIAKRLVVAAGKVNRFDAAVTGYIAAVLGKSSRSAVKPEMPDAKSTYLATAVSEVEAALKGPKLSTDQKQALLSFLLDLHKTRGDQKGMTEVTQQMLKAGAGAANDPAAAGALARMKLDVASVAIENKQYKKAADEINASRAAFVDPKDQAAALYLLAQAQEGLAGEDATALADAALAYMRVVAHASNVPGKPHVADALLKTASILERTKNNKDALELYQQVASQFADDPAAAKSAQQAVQRLGAQQSSSSSAAPAAESTTTTPKRE
jgi:TolA-binding protein